MTPPTNLYEYFLSKGQKLPSVEERRKLYGFDESYVGSTDQNASLLERLLKEDAAPQTGGTTPKAGGTPALGANFGDAGPMTAPPPPSTSPFKLAITDLAAPTAPTSPYLTELDKITSGSAAQPTLRDEKARLERERGIDAQREVVGSFEEEIGKTMGLLDQLEEDINVRTKDYLVTDPQRRRILASEQAPITKSLGILERGYTSSLGQLERGQQDILTELGLIEKERTEPLDLLERQVKIRSDIMSLTKSALPQAVTSQFNEDGDLTIVTQDPATGAYSTQILKGIGEKAQKYQTITQATNAKGDLTIVGVTRDGRAETLGIIKGAGGGGAGTTDYTRVSDVKGYFSEVKGDDGKVTAEQYNSAQQGWIASGGNITDFKSAFPTDMIREDQFLSGDYLKTLYGSALEGEVKKAFGIDKASESELAQKAKEAGFNEGGFLGIGTGPEGVAKYIDSITTQYLSELMAKIQQYRSQGYSDKKILELMQ